MSRIDPTGALPWLGAGCALSWVLMAVVRALVDEQLAGALTLALPFVASLGLGVINLVAATRHGAHSRARGRWMGALLAFGLTLPAAVLSGAALRGAAGAVDALILWALVVPPVELVQLGGAWLAERLWGRSRGGFPA